MTDHDEMSSEMHALAHWQPPEPLTVPLPDLDSILAGVQIQPWLLEYARRRCAPMTGNVHGDPTSCATAIGRLARLYSPQDKRQLRQAVDDALAARPTVMSRCVDWARSLTQPQCEYILRCALLHTDRLHERLRYMRDAKAGRVSVEDGALGLETFFLAEDRDDQDSLLFVLTRAEAADVSLLESSLRRFDQEAQRYRALIESLPWPDHPLLRAIACSDVTAWWGYIEGSGHIWGLDDLMRDENGEA